MSNKYAYIRTAAELDKAIRSVTSEHQRLGKLIERDVRQLKRQYNPSRLARYYFSFASWSGIGLGLVRGLKRLIKGRK